jgi:hypothetical protein
LVQTREHANRLERELSEAIKNFPGRYAAPLKTASEQTKETIDKLTSALIERFESVGSNLAIQIDKLASTADTVTSSLEEVQSRLRAMQTPDGIIEVKLQPFISGFTKAINNQAKLTIEQMTDLKKIIAVFDESVGKLAERMAEAGNRSLDQVELVSRLEATSAETRQLLKGIDNRLSAVPLPTPERNGLFGGWLKGRA